MIRKSLISIWSEPRVEGPPERVWRDWALVVLALAAVVIEFALRDDLIWRPVAIGHAIAVIIALLWRRRRPLASVLTAFGGFAIIDAVALLTGTESVGIYSAAITLVLPCALFRWASGRHAAIGLGVMLVPYTPWG